MITKYRNNEELFFSYYLDELKKHNIIESYEYEPKSFLLSDEVTFNYTKITQLKTKVKVEEKTKALLHKHSYTPDFKIIPETIGYRRNIFSSNPKDFPIFIVSDYHEKYLGRCCNFVDVKGTFSRNLSTSITFPLNAKWMYQKYRIYVQKIKPFDLFKQTFTPKKVVEEMKYKRDYYKKGKLLAKKGDSKLDYKYLNIEEWLKKV